MDLKAKEIIASLPAVEPAVGQHGPLMGHNTANAVAEALERADYRIIHMRDLKALGDGMAKVLAMIDGK
jgi:hypothetical protein